MSGTSDIRRVMIAAHPDKQESMRALFQSRFLNDWEVIEAGSFTQARFNLQFDPCDVLVVHQDLMENEGGQGLSWLVWNKHLPVVFLSATGGLASARAYELGASMCLSAEEVIAHPILLARALERVLHCHHVEQNLALTRERLNQSRRHVDRLVNVMWRVAPTGGDTPWFSQRYMMDRLQEELSRAERHKVPLSLAIGELSVEDTEGNLPHWAVDAIVRGKRKSDVAGQYGQNGFLLLMVHTPPTGGLNCVRRIQKVIEHPVEDLNGPHTTPRAYFGLASAGDQRRTAVALLRAAEEGLEAARGKSPERIVAN